MHGAMKSLALLELSQQIEHLKTPGAGVKGVIGIASSSLSLDLGLLFILA